MNWIFELFYVGMLTLAGAAIIALGIFILLMVTHAIRDLCEVDMRQSLKRWWANHFYGNTRCINCVFLHPNKKECVAEFSEVFDPIYGAQWETRRAVAADKNWNGKCKDFSRLKPYPPRGSQALKEEHRYDETENNH